LQRQTMTLQLLLEALEQVIGLLFHGRRRLSLAGKLNKLSAKP